MNVGSDTHRALLIAGPQVWGNLLLLLLTTLPGLAYSIHATWGPPFSQALFYASPTLAIWKPATDNIQCAVHGNLEFITWSTVRDRPTVRLGLGSVIPLLAVSPH